MRALSAKEIPTNKDLYEAMADSFATRATAEFQAGIIQEGESKPLEWQEAGEVVFETKALGQIFLGFSEQERYSTVEGSSGFTVGDTSFFVERNGDHFESHTFKENPLDDHQIPNKMKHIIIEALLEGTTSKIPQ